MDANKLSIILEQHKKWLIDSNIGERANLRNANLRNTDLRSVDLRNADLQGADLRGADLRSVDLQDADLRNADLRNADLDFACWPLWCGSFGVQLLKKNFVQLVYHLCKVEVDDEECKTAQMTLYSLANQFHRVDECGMLGTSETNEYKES